MNRHTELDHLVIGCHTLDQGRAWCRERFGVEASGGGSHAHLGTHNTLLSLGPKHYLEFIAIDTDAHAATMPRWFGLDTPEVKAFIAHEPRLIAWVARVTADTSIEQIAATQGNEANVVRPAERGDFRWRFAFTQDGARPRSGVLPHFIQWDVPQHPCERLPDHGVRLTSLLLGDPAPDEVATALAAVAFTDERVQVAQSATRHLAATFATPHDVIVID